MRSHRHTPEIEEQLGYAAGEPVLINFTPHLVPMQRGILVTAYASLKKDVTYEEVKAVYDKYYNDEFFVRVLNKDVCPQTRWVESSNFVDVNFKIDPRTKRIIMMGAMEPSAFFCLVTICRCISTGRAISPLARALAQNISIRWETSCSPGRLPC